MKYKVDKLRDEAYNDRIRKGFRKIFSYPGFHMENDEKVKVKEELR